MKKIYIILMHTNTIPARIIRLATRYKYSHVAISFERNCNMTYSFGRKNINSVLDAGFVKEYKNGKFFRKFNKTECKIYEINVTDEQYYNAWHIIKNMEKHKEVYKYFLEYPWLLKIDMFVVILWLQFYKEQKFINLRKKFVV